jgi:hypothetical protein
MEHTTGPTAIRTSATRNCLGSTCLKWGADGELTALDRELVMERLAQVDHGVAALRQARLDRPRCPSIG